MARGESIESTGALPLRTTTAIQPGNRSTALHNQPMCNQERELVEWAGRFSAWEGFQLQGRKEAEITHDNMCYLREVFLGTTQSDYKQLDWPLLARKVFEAQRQVGWRSYEPLLRWIKDDRTAAEQSLAELWGESPPDPIERMRRFLGCLPEALRTLQPGARIGLASALMAANGSEWVPYQASIAKSTAKITRRPVARSSSDCEIYLHYLEQLDRIVEGAQESGYPINNRADARASLSWVIKGREWLSRGWGPAKDGWTEQTIAEFAAWRADV